MKDEGEEEEEYKRSVQWNEWIDRNIPPKHVSSSYIPLSKTETESTQSSYHDCRRIRQEMEHEIRVQIQQLLLSVTLQSARIWINRHVVATYPSSNVWVWTDSNPHTDGDKLENVLPNDMYVIDIIIHCEDHTQSHFDRLKSNMDVVDSYLYEMQFLQGMKTALLETVHQHLHHHNIHDLDFILGSFQQRHQSRLHTSSYMKWLLTEIRIAIRDVQELSMLQCHAAAATAPTIIGGSANTSVCKSDGVHTDSGDSVGGDGDNETQRTTTIVKKKKKKNQSHARTDPMLRVKKVVIWGKRKDGRAIVNRWGKMTHHQKDWSMGFTRAQLVHRPLGITRMSSSSKAK